MIVPDNLPGIFSELLRATYLELLEDTKLVGVWSGKVSNSYLLRDESPSAVPTGNGK